jgi:hypothetical protein
MRNSGRPSAPGKPGFPNSLRSWPSHYNVISTRLRKLHLPVTSVIMRAALYVPGNVPSEAIDMDLSKLPKLSKTPENQSPPPSHSMPPDSFDSLPPGSFPLRELPAPAIGLAEAWISIGLGILVLFIFPNTIKYIHSPTQFQQDVTSTDKQGNPIPYLQSIFFWTDLGVTVFAVALIFEGIILALARKIAPLAFAFAITCFAALFNVFVIIRSRGEIEFPIFCGVAVVVLGYMALTQLRLIHLLRQSSSHETL